MSLEEALAAEPAIREFDDPVPWNCRARIDDETWEAPAQCHRPAGEGGWCGQHHPEAVARRARARERRHSAKLARMRSRRVQEALELLMQEGLICEGCIDLWDRTS